MDSNPRFRWRARKTGDFLNFRFTAGSFSFMISRRIWSSKRFPIKMRKLRVLLAQLPEVAQLAQAQFRILFSKCRTSLPCFRVRGRCRPLWCLSPPGATPARSALPNVRSSPPGVSSLLSSTGPRLPLQTQVSAGSPFGFWAIVSRALLPCAASCYLFADFVCELLRGDQHRAISALDTDKYVWRTSGSMRGFIEVAA